MAERSKSIRYKWSKNLSGAKYSGPSGLFGLGLIDLSPRCVRSLMGLRHSAPGQSMSGLKYAYKNYHRLRLSVSLNLCHRRENELTNYHGKFSKMYVSVGTKTI